MTEEDIVFYDGETEFPTNQGATIKDIIFQHLGKISTISTKEFKEGYWSEKPVATAGGFYVAKTYHEDMRHAYCNAVDFLNDMIFPKCKPEESADLITIEAEYPPKEDSKYDPIDLKVQNRRKIFRRISQILKRDNYLEARAIT